MILTLPTQTTTARPRVLLWPVRFAWRRHASLRVFDRHTWEVGTVAMVAGRRALVFRVLGQTLHLGRFKVIMGPRSAEVRDTPARALLDSQPLEQAA